MGALSHHPNIVTLYAAGYTLDGQPYMVMTYVADGTLQDRIRRDSGLPWRDALDIGLSLCGALETSHRAGVLHREHQAGQRSDGELRRPAQRLRDRPDRRRSRDEEWDHHRVDRACAARDPRRFAAERAIRHLLTGIDTVRNDRWSVTVCVRRGLGNGPDDSPGDVGKPARPPQLRRARLGGHRDRAGDGQGSRGSPLHCSRARRRAPRGPTGTGFAVAVVAAVATGDAVVAVVAAVATGDAVVAAGDADRLEHG